MRHYQVRYAEKSAFCAPSKEGMAELFHEAENTTQPIADWNSPQVKIVRADGGVRLNDVDVYYLVSGGLVANKRAVAALGPLLGKWGELLPLTCKSDSLALFHSLTFIDAVDEIRSDITRFDDGRIMLIHPLVIDTSRVKQAEIFRLAGYAASSLYVGQAFVDAYRRAGLAGLEFDPIE